MSNKDLEAAKQLTSDYKFVFSSKEGKRVLENIISECHVLEPNNSIETNVVLIQEGRRDAFVHQPPRGGHSPASRREGRIRQNQCESWQNRQADEPERSLFRSWCPGVCG